PVGLAMGAGSDVRGLGRDGIGAGAIPGAPISLSCGIPANSISASDAGGAEDRGRLVGGALGESFTSAPTSPKSSSPNSTPPPARRAALASVEGALASKDGAGASAIPRSLQSSSLISSGGWEAVFDGAMLGARAAGENEGIAGRRLGRPAATAGGGALNK